jgi:hypothetical protein
MIACSCALALALAFAAEPADIAETMRRAERHFERGIELENNVPDDDPARARAITAEAQREFMLASDAFGEAYVATGRPVFVYARAQALRLAGRCDLAVPYYDEFLAKTPTKADTPEADAALQKAIQEAKANRNRCTASEPPRTVPPPKVDPTPPADGPTPPDGPRRQWVRDPAGGVLVALGGVAGIIGATLIGFAATRDGSAGSAGTEGEYVHRKGAARIQHRVGIAVAAVGGAMLVAGITRWGVLAARERKRRASAGVAPTRRGATLSVSVWF